MMAVGDAAVLSFLLVTILAWAVLVYAIDA